MTVEIYGNGQWNDITPYIAFGGLTFSRNDVDAPRTGRAISGLMYRGRVAVKEKMNVQTIQLTRAQSAWLQELLYPQYIQVRVTPYPRTNSVHQMQMYSNNVKATYTIHYENGEDMQSLSFPLIER